MLARRSYVVATAAAAVLLLGAAGPSGALEKCKAKIRGNDSTIEVSAKDVVGPLRWGETAATVVESFDDPTCVANGKAAKCTLGPEGSLARITPPPSCTVYLADDVDACATLIPKCTPGVRRAEAMPYLGEIRMFAGNFAPTGWAMCNGQLLSVSLAPDLFSVLGTTYGGDGRTTFALPDLRGRVPLHHGNGPGLRARTLGEEGGEEEVQLTIAEMPSHDHGLRARNAPADESTPTHNLLAIASTDQYAHGTANVPMSPDSIDPTGGSEAHENMPPFATLNFIIALEGIYPER